MAAPVYNHLASNTASGGAAVTIPAITVPANGYIVARIKASVNSGQTLTLADGSASLTWTTPSGAVGTAALGTFGIYDTVVQFFVAQAGGGGFNDTLIFDAGGADHVLYTGWEVGYFSSSDCSGFANGIGNSFAANSNLKQLTYGSSPAAGSTLLSCWGDTGGGGPGNWTPKSSPGWSTDSNSHYFAGGTGGMLSSHRYEGAGGNPEATPSDVGNGYFAQVGAAIEVLGVGGASQARKVVGGGLATGRGGVVQGGVAYTRRASGLYVRDF